MMTDHAVAHKEYAVNKKFFANKNVAAIIKTNNCLKLIQRGSKVCLRTDGRNSRVVECELERFLEGFFLYQDSTSGKVISKCLTFAVLRWCRMFFIGKGSRPVWPPDKWGSRTDLEEYWWMHVVPVPHVPRIGLMHQYHYRLTSFVVYEEQTAE